MLLHSFLSLLAVTPVPRKPLRILSPLQKLLIRSRRLRLLPLPPLLLIRPLLTLPPLPLRNNSATDRFTDKNSKRLPMESLTIFIPVTLLILSYSILLFPSYLITIYISSSLIIFSASLCSSLLFTASPTVRKSPDHNKNRSPKRAAIFNPYPLPEIRIRHSHTIGELPATLWNNLNPRIFPHPNTFRVIRIISYSDIPHHPCGS